MNLWKRNFILFGFPNPVNEFAARLVAGMVAILTALVLIFESPFLMIILTCGFLARVLTGPRLSPMGLIATKVIIPLLGNPRRPVAGPPKRFAQTIGLVISSMSLVFYFVLNMGSVATALLAILLGFAILESVLGFCAGCFIFGYLMKWGLIPEKICESCRI